VRNINTVSKSQLSKNYQYCKRKYQYSKSELGKNCQYSKSEFSEKINAVRATSVKDISTVRPFKSEFSEKHSEGRK
jgi:hypothetical protein